MTFAPLLLKACICTKLINVVFPVLTTRMKEARQISGDSDGDGDGDRLYDCDAMVEGDRDAEADRDPGKEALPLRELAMLAEVDTDGVREMNRSTLTQQATLSPQ